MMHPFQTWLMDRSFHNLKQVGYTSSSVAALQLLVVAVGKLGAMAK